MIENWSDYSVRKEMCMPTKIKASAGVRDVEELLVEKSPSVSFHPKHFANFQEKGAYVLLDFGREVCGGVRLLVRAVFGDGAKLRITLGESITEACSDLGEKKCNECSFPA